MQRLIEHIEYLLDGHDCVVVPGFGAFIKRHLSATIDEATGRIMPPRSEVSFNNEISFDDGLLASSYSRALGIPYTGAVARIADDVAMLKAYIDRLGEVVMGSLGVVSNVADTFKFQPANSVAACGGLREHSLIEVEVVKVAEKPVVLPAPGRYARRVHSVMKYAAMIVILLGLGILFSTSLVYNGSENVVMASMNPIKSANVAESTFPQVAVEEIIPELFIALPQETAVEETAAIADEVEVTEPKVAKEADESTHEFCLVIASLATAEQANQFLERAGDDAKGVFEINGRYRVYGATGQTAADVMKSSLRERYVDAWPCRLP